MSEANKALEAFERIWKNEAIGGDYQLVVDSINNNAPVKTVYKRGYSKIKEYKNIIQLACGCMQQAIDQLPDGANKKRIQNFIKRYWRYA